ncbi:MAG: NFACT family protein [Oscillospiraceae bacterium]|nr:NFACT family protein [Oscillospiraceae bacterium]
MPFDGLFLRRVKNEIESRAIGGRIDKIHQPDRYDVMLSLRTKTENLKLLISANPSSSRIHFTESVYENPQNPPMFCMLLRKHLSGARLVSLRQQGLDRILYLDFETKYELGDIGIVTIAAEMLGRRSNIVVINEQNMVIDAARRSDDLLNNARRVFPGCLYESVVPQSKLNLLESSDQDIFATLTSNTERSLSKALSDDLMGFSPLISREAAHYTSFNTEMSVSELRQKDYADRLVFYLSRLRETLSKPTTDCTMLLFDGKPKDFYFTRIGQYGNTLTSRAYSCTGGLLDGFYSERDRANLIKQRSDDILKLLLNKTERISRKIELQKIDLEKCRNRDRFRIYGDILSANLHLITKGMTSVKLTDFYDQDQAEVEIALDQRRTPGQNAQHYYKEYKKAVKAEEKLTSLIESAKQELLYLDSVFDAVTRAGLAEGDNAGRATVDSQLREIRLELEEQGYLKHSKVKTKPKPVDFMRFLSKDGYTILCGRNNRQNDRLVRESKGSDIWLHTQNIPGSHVVIVTDGRIPPDSTIEEACVIAANNSKARESSQIPVDYTLIKNVKKPPGSKPGMVTFTGNRTVVVRTQL